MGVSETFNNIKVLVLKEASSSANFSHETLQPASQYIKINILFMLCFGILACGQVCSPWRQTGGSDNQLPHQLALGL